MVHIGMSPVLEPIVEIEPFGSFVRSTRPPVLIVRGDDANNALVDLVCEFLDLNVEHVSIDNDISPMISVLRPMAIITDLVGEWQDGYHIMKLIAAYDRDLPVLLLTDGDAILLGAVEAVQEAWGLTHVATVTGEADVGSLVDFLCHASREAGMYQLMQV